MTTSNRAGSTAALCRHIVAVWCGAALAATLATGCLYADEDPPPGWPGGNAWKGDAGDDADSGDADNGDASDAQQESDGSNVDELTDEDGVCLTDDTSCVDEGSRICREQDTPAQRCAEGCSEDACAGDTCEEAIPVDLSEPGAVVTLEGDQQAFEDHWNAAERPGCSLYEDEQAGPTDGPEIFLAVDGFNEGDLIEFDARDSSTNFAFYILEECGSSGCLDAGAHDEDLAYRHRWEAADDRPVRVAAEVFGPERDRPFRIDIRRFE
ncbi:MAG: hypothetical protein ACOCV2_03205 [Persicimonas sp.]